MGGKGKSYKGGGKGKTQSVVKTIIKYVEVPVKTWGGKSKGKGKGKGGKKGGKSFGKGKRVPFSELPEETKQAIKEKHAERAAEEGRETVGNQFFFGELLKRNRFNGWIKPANFGKFPPKVKTALQAMTESYKAKAEEKGQMSDTFVENSI